MGIMKLRIKDNALRVRIQQHELSQLHNQGELISEVRFGPAADQVFSYKLVASNRTKKLEAAFYNQCICITVPRDAVLEMVQTERVGISNMQSMEDGDSLSLVFEKDFKCLTPREEDSDAFPHPAESVDHQC